MSSQTFYPGIVRLIVSPIDDGLNLVSTTTSTLYNVSQRVSPQASSSWKIIAYGISSSVASAFSIHSRVHVKGTFTDTGIVRPVVWPLDVKSFIPQSSWDVVFRKSSYHSSQWKISQRRSSRKASSFSIYDYGFASRAASWRVLGRVRKPGVTVGFWVNEIVTDVVHPLSVSNFSPVPKIQWELNQRVKPSVKIRFNIRVPANATRTVAWNTDGLPVTKQIAATYNLKKQVSPKASSYWRLPSRRAAKRSVSWEVRIHASSSKAIKWRYLDKVTKTNAVRWNAATRRNKPVVSRWHDLSRYGSFSRILFRALNRIVLKTWSLSPTIQSILVRPVVWPVDIQYPLVPPSPYRGIVRTVVFPLSYPFFAGLNASPGITWRTGINPNGRVSATKAAQFNVHDAVVSRNSSAWTTVGRRNFTIASQFNTYNLVKGSTIIEWNTGAAASGFIRQTSQQRTDFAF